MSGYADDSAQQRAADTRSRVVRLPVVPRDAALGEGRPLSEVARANGDAYLRWMRDCMSAPEIDPPFHNERGRALRKLATLPSALLGRTMSIFLSREQP